jgi:hypothetical protein
LKQELTEQHGMQTNSLKGLLKNQLIKMVIQKRQEMELS